MELSFDEMISRVEVVVFRLGIGTREECIKGVPVTWGLLYHPLNSFKDVAPSSRMRAEKVPALVWKDKMREWRGCRLASSDFHAPTCAVAIMQSISTASGIHFKPKTPVRIIAKLGLTIVLHWRTIRFRASRPPFLSKGERT